MLYCMYNSYKAFTCMEPTHFRSSLPHGYSPNCRGHTEAHGAMFPRLTAGLFPVMPAFLLPSDLVGTLTASGTWEGPHSQETPQVSHCVWCLTPKHQSKTQFRAGAPDGDKVNLTYIIHFTGDEVMVMEKFQERKWMLHLMWNCHLMLFEEPQCHLLYAVVYVLGFCRHPRERGYHDKMVIKILVCCNIVYMKDRLGRTKLYKVNGPE